MQQNPSKQKQNGNKMPNSQKKDKQSQQQQKKNCLRKLCYLCELWPNLIKEFLSQNRHQYQIPQYQIDQIKQITKRGQTFKILKQTVHYNSKRIFLEIFENKNKNNKIILYLHGAGSSKREGYYQLNYLNRGYSLAIFDFIGSGRNYEDNRVTYGIEQSKQIQTVVKHLKEMNYSICLWGRSMGAVAALKYAKSGQVKTIVADSPFQSLKRVGRELAGRQCPYIKPLITCLFPCFYSMFRSSVLKKGKFDIDETDITQDVKKIPQSTTIIFVCGKADTLIDSQHSEDLCKMFQGCDKHLQFYYGNHNDGKPDYLIKQIMNKIQFYIPYPQKIEQRPNQNTSAREIKTLNEQTRAIETDRTCATMS